MTNWLFRWFFAVMFRWFWITLRFPWFMGFLLNRDRFLSNLSMQFPHIKLKSKKETNLAGTQARDGGMSKNWTWVFSIRCLLVLRYLFNSGSSQTTAGHQGKPSNFAQTKFPRRSLKLYLYKLDTCTTRTVTWSWVSLCRLATNHENSLSTPRCVAEENSHKLLITYWTKCLAREIES